VNLLKLSTVIITKNEQQNIARCLSSVKDFSDEILVYDSGSTDETVSIANKMGVKVVSGEWLGFGATKHKAADLARNDWILSIDADEEVSEKLKNEIQKNFLKLQPESAYAVPRSSFFLGRWIRFGGWSPDYQIRLFNKKYSQWNMNSIHEKVEAKSIQYFSEKLNHYVFKNISHQVQTNDRYSGLLAEKMKNEGKKMSWFHFLTKPSVKFFECYFLKLGFLDGYAGFVIAKNAGYSVFLKWAKFKELDSK
jgi:glycosyltransferase involved in cell wall biosynthesis